MAWPVCIAGNLCRYAWIVRYRNRKISPRFPANGRQSVLGPARRHRNKLVACNLLSANRTNQCVKAIIWVRTVLRMFSLIRSMFVMVLTKYIMVSFRMKPGCSKSVAGKAQASQLWTSIAHVRCSDWEVAVMITPSTLRTILQSSSMAIPVIDCKVAVAQPPASR
jgi:hypothetical protein